MTIRSKYGKSKSTAVPEPQFVINAKVILVPLKRACPATPLHGLSAKTKAPAETGRQLHAAASSSAITDWRSD